MWYKALALLACGLCVGCQVTPTAIDLTYQPYHASNHQAVIEQAEGRSCKWALTSYQDVRHSPNLGVVAFSKVESEVNRWVLQALAYHNIVPHKSVLPVTIDVVLKKAYIQSLSTSMSVNIVLGIKVGAGQTRDWRYFRGHEVDLNWNSGEKEIQAVFNKALTKVITKIRLSNQKGCQIT